MNRKKEKMLLILLLLALIGLGCYFPYRQAEESSAAESSPVLYGNVEVHEIALAFRGSDRLIELYADEGDQVRQGQLLARLDSQELSLSIEKQKFEIAAQENAVSLLHQGTRAEVIMQAQQKMEALKAISSNAQSIRERTERLFKAGSTSRQELDNAIFEARSRAAETAAAEQAYAEAVAGPRPAEIKQAEAKLAALRQELKRLEYLLALTELFSPVDGVIRSRLLEVGDMASATSPVFRIALNEQKWVRVYIKETLLSRIHEGQLADIYIDSMPDKPLQGKVGFISPTAEFTPKTVQTEELRTSLLYAVRIQVRDEDNVLRLGMPTTVKIHD